jgi:hypothetical protein
MTMASMLAVATGTVQVTFSSPPLAQSPNGTNDALNPQSWTLTRLDTGATFPVVSVVPLNEDEVSPVDFLVSIYGTFPDFSVTLQAATPTLLAADGSTIGTPFTATCPGLIAVAVSNPDELASSMSLSPTDIANPPFSGLTGGGTLQVGPDGDYVSDTGITLLKKLIIRRLFTSLGGFYHLPDYGAGLAVKSPLPLGEVVKFQQNIVQQVQKETGVAKAAAQVTVQAGVVVQVQIAVQTTQGATFSIGIPLTGAPTNQGA